MTTSRRVLTPLCIVMRRQRVLRASSAQSLCIFCACRLGVQVPSSQVAPLIPSTPRRDLNTRTAPLRQNAAAAASTNDHGPSNGEASSFQFDPNSSLTLAEQQEKARRMQLQRDNEAKAQQLKQEQMWRETEARPRAQIRWSNRDSAQNSNQDQQRRGGWGRNNADRKKGTNEGVSKESAMQAPIQGQTLGQAMSGPRLNAQSSGRTTRIEGRPLVRKQDVYDKTDPLSRSSRGQTQSSEPSSTRSERGLRKRAMPSFLASTAPAAASPEPDTASDWDAAGNETLPVSYGAASEIRNTAIRDVLESEEQERDYVESPQTASQDAETFPSRAETRRGRDSISFRPRKDEVELPSGDREDTTEQPLEAIDEPASYESPVSMNKVADQAVHRMPFLQDEEPSTARPVAERQHPNAESISSEPKFVRASNMGSFGYYENSGAVHEQEPYDAPAEIVQRSHTLDQPAPTQTEDLRPASVTPPVDPVPVKAESVTQDDFEFFGFGIEVDSADEPELSLTQAANVGSVQPPQAPLQPTQQNIRPQARASVDSSYRSVPFDPSEDRQETASREVDNSANWQHLRRKATEPPPQVQQHDIAPPPPPQPMRSFFDDEDWVDRKFEEHRQSRPYAPPAAQIESTLDRDDRPLSNPARPKSALKCGRCGERGHVARDCTQPNNAICRVCGGKGHISHECPVNQTPQGRSQFRHIVDDPYEDERSPRVQPQVRRPRRASIYDDPFAMPQVEQRTQPVRRVYQPDQASPFEEPARVRDRGDETRRSNPFGASDSGVRGGERSQRREDGRFDNRGNGRAQERYNPRMMPAQPEADAEEASRRQEARVSRRSQKWADAEDQVESDRSSKFTKDKERRGGRRDFDEDNDEEVGAREEYRARKAARQAKEMAVRQVKEKVGRQERQAKKAGQTTPITLPEWTSVQQLSQLLGVRYEQFVERLEDLGYDDIFPNKTLNSETSGMIAMEYNFEPSFDFEGREEDERDLKALPEPEDKEVLPVRPPVVTIMGHVDHGKTTILDYLRKSSVAAGEAGGITQHIGAFSVSLASSGKTVTFLDTPGHAAFLAMRQRGANVTDIVILVVAADDSVKPQTLEALKHAKAAGVPMIVAINKVDKEGADIQRCKQDLARHGVEIEDFGGETQVVCVSGKTGQGMDELEENVVTLSEILDHRADTDGTVEGWVLEATTKKAGRVATVLVRRGTLKPGCVLVAGKTWTRVRTLRNEGGFAVREVGPGMPVEVDGWRDQPVAGDEVLQAETEQKATSVVEFRQEKDEREKIAEDTEAINESRRLEQERREKEKAAEAAAKRVASVKREDESISSAIPGQDAEEEQSGQMAVPFIIKADVSGSAEAVSAYIMSVSNPLITPQILSSAVGAIHESDIDLAHAASGHIIAFNLPADPDMKALAEHRGVKILENNIIYRVLDDVKAVLEDKLPPIITQRVLGEAEIALEFEIGVGGRKKVKIAGCKVRNGVVSKGARVRVTRNGEKVYEGTINSLKNVKKDVQEMRKGTECGMGFEDWEGFQPGDQIQTFAEISEKRKL